MEDDDNENNAPQVHLLGKTYLNNSEKFYIRNDPIIYMAAGDRHTIIVTGTGRAYTFGDNNSGQLGLGHTDVVKKITCIKSLKFGNTGEKVILAACGRESSLVATNYGLLYAFGLNDHCQLGFRSEQSMPIYPDPIKIEHFHLRMSWKQISMGSEHACALTDTGVVYVWGSNDDGQCGQAPKYDTIEQPRRLQLEYLVIAISCGYYHTAIISEDRRLFLFGNNSSRQLGRSISSQDIGPLQVSFPDPVKAVACGYQHTVVLTEEGEVYTCGNGDCGQLGLGPNVLTAEYFEVIDNLPRNLTAIAAGEAHTAILGPRGDIYVFGDGKHGKLSDDSQSNKFQPCPINKFKGYHVLNVVCGGCQTVILAKKKSTWDEDDIENPSLPYVQPLETTDNTNYSRSSYSHTESNSDSDEMSRSMRSALMNSTVIGIKNELVQIHPPFKSVSLPRYNEDSKRLKTGVLDRTAPLIRTSNDSSEPNNRFSSTNQPPEPNARSDRTDPEKNLRKRPNSNEKLSLSEDPSLSDETDTNKTTHSTPQKTFPKNYHRPMLSDKKDGHKIRQSPSATTNDDSSSSTSSDHKENQIIDSEPVDNSQNKFRSPATETHAQSDTTNSSINSTTTETKSGFFARIFGAKSSQNLSTATNKSSRMCAIM